MRRRNLKCFLLRPKNEERGRGENSSNMGFHVYKRTDHDEQGNPYPLLYMKLK